MHVQPLGDRLFVTTAWKLVTKGEKISMQSPNNESFPGLEEIGVLFLLQAINS